MYNLFPVSKEELERLAILNEECAEVQHIISKILRHGFASHDPTINTDEDVVISNRRLLAKELGDLLYSIGMIIGIDDVSERAVSIQVSTRSQNIRKYLKHESNNITKNTIKALFHYRDSTVGCTVTDIPLDKIFDNAMQHKSDANPFSEDGECQVLDGYNHIKKSVTEYLKAVTWELNL